MINVYSHEALLNAYPPASFRFAVSPPHYVCDEYGLISSYYYTVIGAHLDSYDSRVVIDIAKAIIHE